MSWSNIRLILLREIRDQLRDRRTMFMIVVLPVLLYPLLGIGLTQVTQIMREKPLRILVFGTKNNLPERPPLLDGDRFQERWFSAPERAKLLVVDLERPEGGTPTAAAEARTQARFAIQEGDYEAALYFPADFVERLDAFQQSVRQRSQAGAVELRIPKPEILYSTASEKSQIAYARLSEVLRRWTDAIGRESLKEAGVPESAAMPVETEAIDVADEAGLKGAAVWSKILPVLLLIWAMTGAFYPAVDLCAGEKERGTLETLLSSPARRSEIVLGKLATIMLFSAVTAVLNIVSMGALGWIVLSNLPGFGPPPLWNSMWLLAALPLVSALFSALCLALAAFARSTKEGQYYLMPLLLVTLPLATLPAFSAMELDLGNSLVPVTGIVLVLRTALEGNEWQALQFLPPVLIVTGLCCLAAIRWAIDQFNTESVLFRESERLDLGLWLQHLLRDRQPLPSVAEAVLCGVLILVIRFFLGLSARMPTQFADFAVMQVATQLAMVAAPALLMTVMLTSRPRDTLLLRMPRWQALPAALLLAVAIHPLVRLLERVVTGLYPFNEQVQESLSKLNAALADAPLLPLLAIIALLPAVVEELAFRGFILAGLRGTGKKWRPIVYSSLFFGFSHAIMQQSLISAIIGVAIGLMAFQTGSLLPGVIFHFTNNALGVLSSYIPAQWLEQHPMMGQWAEIADGRLAFRWPAIALAAIVTPVILWWFNRQTPPPLPATTLDNGD